VAVHAETVRRLAEALRVTADYLLGLSDELGKSEMNPAA